LSERACDAYLTALQLDPLGVSSLERLAEVCNEIGTPALASWSRTRLKELRGEQSAAPDASRLAAYQQYAGHLGRT
jgi:hypothetical protein